MLRSYLCDYRNIYIVGEGSITVQTENNREIDGYDTNLILKNNVPFINAHRKSINQQCRRIRHCNAYVQFDWVQQKLFKTFVTLQSYTRDISLDAITNSGSFKCKESITGKSTNDENTKDVEFSVPLKHLRNSWKTLDMPLFNCEVSLTLTLSRHCAITNEKTPDADSNVNLPVLENRAPTGTTFKVKKQNCRSQQLLYQMKITDYCLLLLNVINKDQK